MCECWNDLFFVSFEWIRRFVAIVNCFRVDGARVLGEMLKANSTLTLLDVSCKSLQAHKKRRGVRKPSTSFFVFTVNNIEDRGAKFICSALKKNSTLTFLNMSSDKWMNNRGGFSRMKLTYCIMLEQTIGSEIKVLIHWLLLQNQAHSLRLILVYVILPVCETKLMLTVRVLLITVFCINE